MDALMFKLMISILRIISDQCLQIVDNLFLNFSIVFRHHYSRMLYNLDQLETNLSVLLSELSQIQFEFREKELSAHTNKKTLLIKLPRIILLQNVFIFLSDEDIVKASSVCHALRDAVYSPFGWKILSYTRSQIRYKYKTERLQEEEYGIQDNIEGLTFQVNKQSIAMIQEKRKILKATLKQEYESYMHAKEKYSGVVETIKVEKKLQTKYRDKNKILESQLKILQEKNNSYKETLKQLDSQYKIKMRKYQDQESEIIQQRNKLQNQKQAFVTKIRQYQLQTQKIKKQSVKSQDMLKKVKSFLISRQI